MKPLTFVTGNPNKVIEVQAIIGDKIPIQHRALDIPEIQGTLEDIAKDKCRHAAKIVRDHISFVCAMEYLTINISDQWTSVD